MPESDDLSRRIVNHSMRMRRRMGKDYDPTRIIQRLLLRPVSRENRIGLLILKISELRIRDKLNETLEAIDEYISIVPRHPEPWMILASYYREDVIDEGKAVLASNAAVAIAKLDGNFVRQALGEQLRSLLVANLLDDANSCLAQLLEYKPSKSSIDIALEVDFLSYHNAHKLDLNLVNSYRACLNWST